MQVNSISTAQSFGNYPSQMQIFANLSEDQLRAIAYQKTKQDVNDKKHRRIDIMLYYSMPLSSALSYAVAPSNISRISRLGIGAKLAALFTIPFAAVHAAFGVKKSIDKHNETSAVFSANHPILSAVAPLAGGLLAAAAIRAGGAKLLDKYGEQIATKAKPAVEALAKHLDSSKVLNFASEQLVKAPSALKEFSKSAIGWLPCMILGAQLGHIMNHESVETREYNKNYETLKNVQNAVRTAISRVPFNNM